MQPLISIIIPAHNCALYLSESIDSVLLQAGVNMEIIVIDDGSIDNTKEVLKDHGHGRGNQSRDGSSLDQLVRCRVIAHPFTRKVSASAIPA